MYNLIKMDLYRLFRSVSTYVMILLTAGMACFSIYMTELDLEMMKEQPSPVVEMTDTEPEMVSLGIYVDTDPRWVDGDIDAADMLGIQLGSKLALIFVSIWVTLFVTGERKNGFIKNFAGQFHNRSILVAAKLTAVAVLVFLLLAVYTGVTVICSLYFWGDRFAVGSATELLALLGIQYLLHFAFACFTAFLCVLSGSSALSMAVSLLLCCGFGSLLYHLIDLVIGKSFQIERYVLEENIFAVGAGALSEVAARAVSVGVIVTLAAAILSMLIVQKRDIG